MKMSKNASFPIDSKIIFTLTLLALLFSGFLALTYFGYIDFSKFKNTKLDTAPNNNALCPKTIEDMGEKCCETPSGQTGEIKAVVSMVYVRASCECPTPTQYYDMAPEGGGTLYKLCECKCGE